MLTWKHRKLDVQRVTRLVRIPGVSAAWQFCFLAFRESRCDRFAISLLCAVQYVAMCSDPSGKVSFKFRSYSCLQFLGVLLPLHVHDGACEYRRRRWFKDKHSWLVFGRCHVRNSTGTPAILRSFRGYTTSCRFREVPYIKPQLLYLHFPVPYSLPSDCLTLISFWSMHTHTHTSLEKHLPENGNSRWPKYVGGLRHL